MKTLCLRVTKVIITFSVIVFVLFSNIPTCESDDSDNYVVIAQGCTQGYEDRISMAPCYCDGCTTECCWEIVGYRCDGSISHEPDLNAACCDPYSWRVIPYTCEPSCNSFVQFYAENYPAYFPTANCEEDDCCKEKEKQGIKECCDPKLCPETERGNPVSIITGNNEEIETDLEFGTPHEMKFKLYRTYKSRSNIETSMGYGWTHNYNVVLALTDPLRTDHYRITDESGRYHNYRDIDGDEIYTGYISTKGSLISEPDNTFTWYRANGVTYTFNEQLQLIAKEDGIGNIQTMTYNANGNLETVTDQATSRTISFVYTSDGLIDYITGPVTTAVPDGIWVNYDYDTEGNLIIVEYADDGNGSTASGFEYLYNDPYDAHNLTEKRNLAGEFLSSWTYDSMDRTYENITRDGKGVTISGYGTSSIIATDAQGVDKTYTISSINGRKTITNITGDGCASCGDNDNVVRYGYDEYGRTNEIEYANGRIDQYSVFDETDRYHTEIQAVGTQEERTFYYTYHPDIGDRLTIIESSILGTGDKETIFDYDNDGDTIPNQNPTNLMHRKVERGSTQNESGTVVLYEHVTQYTYNTNGQVLSVDGPLPGDQDKITYTYDPTTGDRLTETKPLVGTTTYAYDAVGNITSITEPSGMITTISYDGRNRQLTTTRNSVTNSYTYTATGELDTTTDAINRTIDYTYNAAGFVEKIIDPSGNFIYYGYNGLGQRTEDSIFGSDDVQTHYRGTDYGDPAGNPDLVSGKPWKSIKRNHYDTTDLETIYGYDASGNLNSVTDANGNVTTYHYDIFNRLYQVIQPGNATTTYTYDNHGNLATVIDAEGNETIYIYDDLGRLVETQSPDTGTTIYSYDEAGNLRFKVQNNASIEYQYDVLGRNTDILYSDTTQNVTMTYDSGTGSNLLGRIASVTDPSGLVEYSYDANGNVEAVTRTINSVVFVTSYDYDDAGNLREIIYPTGHIIEYQPDAVNPALITDVTLDGSQTLASGITYAPFGPVKTMTLGNGIQTSNTYDKNYQILTMVAGTSMDRSYTPDAVGNIEVITDNLDNNRSQSFDYDDLYRLTQAGGIYGTVDFTYDQVGNRLSRDQTGPSSSQNTYRYEPGTNRLKTIVGDYAELFDYDADGNITTRIPGANNPASGVTGVSDYTYGNSGQRSHKAGGTTTIYHYDLSGQLIAETDTQGNLIKAYAWIHGQPLVQIATDGSLYYYHNDHLGTPQKMTDSSGNVVWAADYLPFGKADVTVETIENNLRFPGQYYDNETGLHYNWHRYYDPTIGRYLRADPIGLAGGLNLFAYALNNPILAIDPTGLSSSGKCKISGCCNCEKKKITRTRETGEFDTDTDLFWDVIIEQSLLVASYAAASWYGILTPPPSPHTVLIGLIYEKERWVKEECTREVCLDFPTHPLYYNCKEKGKYWVYSPNPEGIWETYWY